MTFKSLFGQITILSLSLVNFRVSHFHVSHLTHETFKLCLQNTLNMSKTTRVHFGVLHWRCSISFRRGFWFTFFRFYPWWVLKSSGEILSPFKGSFLSPPPPPPPPPHPFFFLLYGPQVDPFFYSPFFLSACRIARGHEEVSTNQAGHRTGTPQETPTASSLVAAMSTKELRLYSQIPA